MYLLGMYVQYFYGTDSGVKYQETYLLASQVMYMYVSIYGVHTYTHTYIHAYTQYQIDAPTVRWSEHILAWMYVCTMPSEYGVFADINGQYVPTVSTEFHSKSPGIFLLITFHVGVA